MRQPPAVATAILTGLGPEHEPLVGDLIEEHRRRQSNLWYWRETIALAAAVSLRVSMLHRWQAIRALAIGWTTLLGLFVVIERLGVADGAAHLIWGWERAEAYATHVRVGPDGAGQL